MFALLPDVPEYQFPAHLSAPSVLAFLNQSMVRCMVILRFFKFACLYPKLCPSEAAKVAELISRLYRALSVESIADVPTPDMSEVEQNQEESILWIHEMRGQNMSAFKDSKKVYDFLLYLILSITRHDEMCKMLFYFMFDYCPLMPYSDASSYSVSDDTVQIRDYILKTFV
jgi:hypothetical protein